MKIIAQKKQNNPTEDNSSSSKRAKQTLNSMYREVTGPEAQLKAIRILTAIAFVFAFVSIFGSQVGFYYDFRLFAHDYSRPTAIVLAVAFEALRVAGILVFFSYRRKDQFHIRAIAMTIVVLVTIIASILHVRGAKSMAVVTTQDTVLKVLEQKHDLAMARVDMAKELQKTTSEAQKYALTNGLPSDDGKTIVTMAGTVRAITDLYKEKKLSAIEYRYLDGQKNQAKVLEKVMMIVLPMVEFFAFLSLFVAYLKTQSVSPGVKELVDTREMLEDMEDSMVAVAKEKMLADFNQKHNLGANGSAPVASSPSPTPQDNPPSPATTTQAPYPALGANGGGEKGQIWSNPNTNYPTLPSTTTPIIGMGNTFFKGTYDNFIDAYEGDGFKVEKFPLVPKEEENHPTPRKKEKKKKTRIVKNGDVFEILEDGAKEEQTTENTSGEGSTALELDLMKFNYNDSQIILMAWDNGTIEVGGRLVKKSLILAELEEQGIKEDDYVTLFRRLKKQKLVIFEMGYVSNAKLINGVNIKG